MTYRISVDTGGTFTDVIVRGDDGSLTIGKALTAHQRTFIGIREAIESAAVQLGLSFDELLDDTTMFIYGTTRATNAIVTKRIAKTAFVTTAGFPDTLLLREGGKFDPHDFTQDYPDPYIPRRDTFEIDERILADGSVSVAFDEAQARRVIEQIGERGFEAVSVCFLWSVANPDHEARFGALLGELLPDVPFTLSHKLIPVVREYRRASATSIDASLKPLMQEHLLGLQEDLREAGFTGRILISTSEGGCNEVEALVDKPIYTVGSGPAMAPIAARTFSNLEGLGDDVIICDTGGTTFDVGLVRGGRLVYSRDTWLGQKYLGDLLGISAVDMRSIGAGGGSIAWIDDGGLLHVGPQSAGSEPGPACYGRGGDHATVSDAAVVLGYFNPDNFLGGRMQLDVAAARRVVGAIADRIGLTNEETAFRIMSLASDLMMRAVADITIKEGFNPRESTLVAGGGAAGINIMTIAKELGCERVILPKVASALSAAGMQYANIVAEKAASLVVDTKSFDAAGVNALLERLETELMEFQSQLHGEHSGWVIELVAEARYEGQVWELDTPLPVRRFDSDSDRLALVEAFHQVHDRVFAVRDEGGTVEIVNWKARLVVDLAEQPKPSDQTVKPKTGIASVERDCYFGAATPVTTAVFRSDDIEPGLIVAGPAIIEEPTTTVVVYPGMSAEVSAEGNYLLRLS
ncbi:hydantoinase/oxoprolinase family protein [Gordonia sp. NPDC003424]